VVAAPAHDTPTVGINPRRPPSLRAGRLAVATPGVLYLVVRGIGIAVYAFMAAANHGRINLHAWDGDWYLQIARHGYLGVDSSFTDLYGHRTSWTPMVFFPGYPLATKIVSFVCGGDFLVAGILVSVLGGVAAAYGVARLARGVSAAPRMEIVAVTLFAALPMSITFALTYPEALLCALTAWALVGMREQRWWLAGPCVLAAGYVSPMAAPLIAVAVVAAFRDALRETGGWWAPVAGTFAPFGMLGYLIWIAATTRSNYFAIQRAGWGNHVDFGVTTVRWLWQTITTNDSAFTVLTAILTVGFAVLTLLLVRQRPPWQVSVYTVLTLGMAIGTAGILFDLQRLLLSAFPVVLPLAAVIARQSRSAVLAWTTSIVVFGLWFGAHSLTVWHYAI
jgi:hypothetical protein